MFAGPRAPMNAEWFRYRRLRSILFLLRQLAR
jgi:hypothetical protein